MLAREISKRPWPTVGTVVSIAHDAWRPTVEIWYQTARLKEGHPKFHCRHHLLFVRCSTFLKSSCKRRWTLVPILLFFSTKKSYCVKRTQVEYIYFLSLSFSLPASDYVEYMYCIHMRTHTTLHLTKSCTWCIALHFETFCPLLLSFFLLHLNFLGPSIEIFIHFSIPPNSKVNPFGETSSTRAPFYLIITGKF